MSQFELVWCLIGTPDFNGYIFPEESILGDYYPLKFFVITPKNIPLKGKYN